MPAIAATAIAACSLGISSAANASVNWSTVKSATAGGGLAALVKAAKAEKTLNVIALPPTWANYGVEIKTFEKKYGIKVESFNPNGTSAQEIEALKQDKGRSSEPDVIDVGESYTAAPDPSLFAPYKVQTWSSIAAAAKDPNGDWYNDYGGYISFGCDMSVVKTCPTTWKALESSQYKGDVTLNGAIGQAAAATDAVYAAGLNSGGSLTNVQAGVNFFNTLKSDGNFNSTDCNSPSVIEAHQCPILINWDYLNSAKSYGLPANIAAHWKVVDPTGKDFAGYYVQAISKYAPHPAAARLWEEFLYSTQGQNIWLEGGARPIELPAMAKAGTENKKAYAALPKVTGTPVLPTVAESTKAGEAIAAAFPS
ncbi:MAG TPA: ABC transporter substrate-binding protein [Solirubrobacteraceae bacterium]|nr:ABC transporter substrate-binding protein [Solirubrobacteraceae bacterium]